MDRLHNAVMLVHHAHKTLFSRNVNTLLEQMTLEYHHDDWIFMTVMVMVMMMNGARE